MRKKSTIQIFLAHASEDKPQVSEVYRKLQQEGYKPWMDKYDLLPGQDWRVEIPKAIKNSQIFIAFLSSTSVQKRGYIQSELRLALGVMAEMPAGQIYLIPLKLNECEVPDLQLPEYGIKLQNIQWLDYWEEDGFERLIRTTKNYFPE